MLQELNVSICGVAPLIMHNGQTCDPLNKFSKQMKEITGKRKKTAWVHRAAKEKL